ncbi:MAG: nucleotidyl transferase AbiEii/AbiGii toxin family protein [Prevotella sp.]|nr:nucleotidyl transferase AbiEii/AbiGii toxin family protein [Prevotella sp.]
MEHSKSLAPHTGKVFEIISRLECIKSYTLVGGTALSLQIEKRQSEDLDFMKWVTKRNEKPEVDWPAIKKELESVGSIGAF